MDNNYHLRQDVETREGWHDICSKIPYLSFPPNYEIKVLPPFGGAIARLYVRKHGCKQEVSVYLDWFARLGVEDNPYWEIYPDTEGDCTRYGLDDVEGLVTGITQSFNSRLTK